MAVFSWRTLSHCIFITQASKCPVKCRASKVSRHSSVSWIHTWKVASNQANVCLIRLPVVRACMCVIHISDVVLGCAVGWFGPPSPPPPPHFSLCLSLSWSVLPSLFHPLSWASALRKKLELCPAPVNITCVPLHSHTQTYKRPTITVQKKKKKASYPITLRLWKKKSCWERDLWTEMWLPEAMRESNST